MILGKWPRHTILSYVFISVLYMFRATPCSSSGESIVWIQRLVYVTLCRWPYCFPTCTRYSHRHRVTYTRGCIDTIDSPDDEHEVARNVQRIELIHRKNVRQVGHIPWIITGCTVNEYTAWVMKVWCFFLQSRSLQNGCGHQVTRLYGPLSKETKTKRRCLHPSRVQICNIERAALIQNSVTQNEGSYTNKKTSLY